MEILALSSGCSVCRATAMLIEKVAAQLDPSIKVRMVEDIQEILKYGPRSLPAVVIDGKLCQLPKANVENVRAMIEAHRAK